MRKGIYIALALCAALCSPTMAKAEDFNYFDSFANGIETLKGNDVSEKVTPEQDFQEEYVPSVEPLDAAPVAEVLPEDATTQMQVSDTVDKIYHTNWFGPTSRTWLESLQIFLLNTGYFKPVLVAAVGIVFMWWGVRKAKNIIVGAFRNGRLSFGSVDRNPNSYYYGTRPSDWR